jgi:hypothetical protein
MTAACEVVVGFPLNLPIVSFVTAVKILVIY